MTDQEPLPPREQRIAEIAAILTMEHVEALSYAAARSRDAIIAEIEARSGGEATTADEIRAASCMLMIEALNQVCEYHEAHPTPAVTEA